MEYNITSLGSGFLTLWFDDVNAYWSEPKIDDKGNRYFIIHGGTEWDASFSRVFRGSVHELKKDFHATAKRFGRTPRK